MGKVKNNIQKTNSHQQITVNETGNDNIQPAAISSFLKSFEQRQYDNMSEKDIINKIKKAMEDKLRELGIENIGDIKNLGETIDGLTLNIEEIGGQREAIQSIFKSISEVHTQSITQYPDVSFFSQQALVQKQDAPHLKVKFFGQEDSVEMEDIPDLEFLADCIKTSILGELESLKLAETFDVYIDSHGGGICISIDNKAVIKEQVKFFDFMRLLSSEKNEAQEISVFRINQASPLKIFLAEYLDWNEQQQDALLKHIKIPLETISDESTEEKDTSCLVM